MKCPNCETDLEGGCSFGGDITCHECGKTYQTDWDYLDTDNIATWITGEVVKEKSEV